MKSKFLQRSVIISIKTLTKVVFAFTTLDIIAYLKVESS